MSTLWTARNFRPPDLPADPELPAADNIDQPRRANSRVSPDPVPDLPAPVTFGLPRPSGPRMPAHLHRANSLVRPDPPRNLRRPEHPALPARNHLGRGPCTLSSPRLYILYPVRLSRVSVGLAHLRDRASLIHPDLLHERDRGPSSEKIHLDSRPPHGEDWLPFVSSLVDFGSCISLCVHGSSTCVIILVGLNVCLVFPFVISPRVLRVLRGIRSFHERSAI